MNVQDVKIEDIIITENSRLKLTDIAELMSSIKQEGLKQPIGVAVAEGGKYKFVFGRRRLEAAKKLGWKTILADVMESIDEKDFLIINLIENLQRVGLRSQEIGRVCVQLQKMGLKIDEIAVRLSLSKTRIKNSVEVYQMVPKKYRDLVRYFDSSNEPRKGDIPATVMTQLLGIRRHYQLTQVMFNKLCEQVFEQGFGLQKVRLLAHLIGEGVSVEHAVKHIDRYAVITFNITVYQDEIEKIKNKEKITKLEILRQSAFGERPPLKRPDFKTK